jgi:hypothetical protein
MLDFGGGGNFLANSDAHLWCKKPCRTPSSPRSASLPRRSSAPPNLRRTAVYGPVRTVVWEGRSRKVPPYPDSRSAASIAVSPPPVTEIDDTTTAAVVGDGGRWPRHVVCRIRGRVAVISWWCGIRRSSGSIEGRSAVSGPRCHIARCPITRCPITRCPITRCPITRRSICEPRCAITRYLVCSTRSYVRRLSASGTRRHINPSICDIDSSRRHVDRLQFARRNRRRR